MPRIFAALAQHGHCSQAPAVPSSHALHPLTTEGTRQAEAAAEALWQAAAALGCAIDPVIDCSSLLCAFQSAEVVARVLARRGGAAPVVEQHDSLAERSLGPLANLTLAEVEHALERDPRHSRPPPRWWLRADYRLPYPGAESLLDAGQRVAHHLVERCAELARRAEVDTVKLFVGHGGPFLHAAVVLGVLELSSAQTLSMHRDRVLLLEQERDHGFRHVAGEWKPLATARDLE